MFNNLCFFSLFNIFRFFSIFFFVIIFTIIFLIILIGDITRVINKIYATQCINNKFMAWHTCGRQFNFCSYHINFLFIINIMIQQVITLHTTCFYNILSFLSLNINVTNLCFIQQPRSTVIQWFSTFICMEACYQSLNFQAL